MASRKDNKGRVLHAGESQRKDGTYQYRYTDVLGRRKYEYAKTLNELREKEEQITKDLVEGINTAGQNMTFDELFELFLKMKRGQVRDTTMDTYGYLHRLVQQYPISRVSIRNIRPSILKEWLFLLVEDGYSQGTVRSLKHLLHGVFDVAVSDDLLRKNPCTFRLFFKEKERTEKFALTLPQQKALLDYVRNSDRFSYCYDLIVVLMGTGVRISELLGLTIKDVDFSRNRIHIRHQLLRDTKSQMFISPPKSEKGNRHIPMTNEVKNSLRRLVSAPRPKQETIIDGHYGFLFINPLSGLPYTRAGVRYTLIEIIDEYNAEHDVPLPHLSPHIFRHTFASTMIQSGMDAKTLQLILGHANVATTLNTYTHLFEDSIANAMEIADEYISANR